MPHSGTATPFAADADLAIEVLRAQGEYGRLTELARENDVHRQRLYELRDQAKEALVREFDEDKDGSSGVEESAEELPPDEQVLFHIPVTVRYLKRVVIALRVMAPASIRDIVGLLAILFGGVASWSFGTVQKILIEAGIRADEFLNQVDLSGIQGAALDEMFSQNQPVLAGVEPSTQYLFLLAVRPSRTGAEWSKVLEELRTRQGFKPQRIVKDAGTGLAKGATEALPDSEQFDDVFHAILVFGKARFQFERRAYEAIAREYELENWRGKDKEESDRRRAGQDRRHAKEHAANAIERFDTFEKLCDEALQFMRLTRPSSGELYTPEEVKVGLERVGLSMMQVGGEHARKAGRYLKNRAPGLGRYLRALAEELNKVAEAAGGPVLVRAVTRLYQAALDARKLKTGTGLKSTATFNEVKLAVHGLANEAGGDMNKVERALIAVVPVLQRRDRASSAIENLNSVLRPYLVVHKSVQQNFLNLFRYFWNMRPREWGRHKGTSAYEQLTGKHVPDWLDTLGYQRQRVAQAPVALAN